jgi:[ribosomal protein S5]-alanine N-acetyltransferase
MPGTNVRLAVRGLVGSDEPAFVSLARTSLPFHRPWIKLPTDSNAFEQYLSKFDNEISFGFVVCKEESIVGFISLSGIERDPYQRGRLGYGVFEQYANMGYMSFGLKQVVRLGFDELGLHRLEADIQPGNEPSRRLVRRNGFTCEGISRRFIRIDGEWMDHERWALTVDEWRHLDDLLSAHKPEQETQKCKEEYIGILFYLQPLCCSLPYPRSFSYGLSSGRTSRTQSLPIGRGKYSYSIFSRRRRP